MKRTLLSLFVLLIANVALAQITFNDINLDAVVTTENEMGYPIYVYGVGEWNAEFYIQNYIPYSSYVACFVEGAGVVVNSGEINGMQTIKPLQEGEMIGSSSMFAISDGAPIFPAIYDAEVFTNWMGRTAYVGFQVKNAGAIHYGWIKMSVNSNNTFTVFEYAYQTSANTPIAAGDKGGVGIESAVVVNNMSLYPNPATSNLTINFTEQVEMVKIYSVEGREMMNFVPNSLTETVNVSSLNSGVYFVVSQKGNEKSVQKLIVK
ncbi:MAG: T9SS type A sorting domain-containing protein [Bacteroidales bacterium]|nr:T9SS type A sorting domain-containing protein [Bacteroidales bacterium]